MITLTSLSKIYRTDEIETVALENVNLTVDRGEFLSIMGPSGCGKSTLLYIMVRACMHPPTTNVVSSRLSLGRTRVLRGRRLSSLPIVSE